MTYDFLENVLNESVNIIIYGAGVYGHVVTKYIMSDAFWADKLKAVAVTETDIQEAICDIPVRCISELEEDYLKQPGTYVVIAVSEEKHIEIIKNLERFNFYNFFCIDKGLFRILNRMVEKDKEIQNLSKYIQSVDGKVNDILWGMNLDRAIADSRWLEKKDFSAGRAAVSNLYLYLMYKILDSGRFHSILDIGMGQTTKMIGQYVKYDLSAEQTVIEASREWADFFQGALALGKNSHIEILDYEMDYFCGEKVRKYAGFKERIGSRKFDFISIDAPIGYDMKNHSRVDILQVLPDCLNASWVIMMDDVDRTGEHNTFGRIKKKLQAAELTFAEHTYFCGEKSFAILTSGDNTLFCTV